MIKLRAVQRIHPKNPAMTLVADRGLANALLGNIGTAKNDLARRIHLGADKWITIPLEQAINLIEDQ